MTKKKHTDSSVVVPNVAEEVTQEKKEEVSSLADDVTGALTQERLLKEKSLTKELGEEKEIKPEEESEEVKEQVEEETEKMEEPIEEEPEEVEEEVEEVESTKKIGPRDSFKVPMDIAGSVATLWSRALREMQRRGILSDECDLPKFFRAEAMGDGSLLLRAINMPDGIVMVGASGVTPWSAPVVKETPSIQPGVVSSIVPVTPQPTGPSLAAPDPRLKTLHIPEEGEVKVG